MHDRAKPQPLERKSPSCDGSVTGLPCFRQGPGSLLLAVDCGLKTGLALFTLNGKLVWYRSHNFGSRSRLKKAAWRILSQHKQLTHLVVEGGGSLAEIWAQEGAKQGKQVKRINAETWRNALLLPRQQQSGKQAKKVAEELARKVIAEAGGAKPTSLTHDAAEAVLIGWWLLHQDVL